MTWDNSKYIKLLLHRPERGPDRWLIALRTTADHYGWTEEFEEWAPKPAFVENGISFFYEPGRRGEMFCEGGRRHRICRSPSKGGQPAGFTNQFKVSSSCTLFDMAELANFTKQEWYWMTSPEGERISRIRWASIYEAGTHLQRRGLVSA